MTLTPPPRLRHPLEGASVGHYRVHDLIGQGGMASVLRAERLDALDPERRWVAIKLLHTHLAREPREVERFLKEIALCARLNHPNVCPILDIGEVGGAPFLVMPYLEGAPLSALSPPALPPPPPEVIATLLVELGRGLSYAHQLTGADGAPLRLVHRDISPHNIVVERSGIVKLLDFGVARVSQAGRSTLTEDSSALIGKVAYMSPERLEEEPFDERADIWALAVTAWELAVGRPLFDATQPMRLMYQVLNAPLSAPAAERLDLPALISDVIMAGLARDPEARPRDAARWVEPLDAWLAGQGLSILDGRAYVSAWLERRAPALAAPAMLSTPSPKPALALSPALSPAQHHTSEVVLSFSDDPQSAPPPQPPQERQPLARAGIIGIIGITGIACLIAGGISLLSAPGSHSRDPVRPVLSPTGAVMVRSSCPAYVLVQRASDERLLGRTPCRLTLSVGVYQLLFNPVTPSERCEARRQLVEIKEGQLDTLDVSLSP